MKIWFNPACSRCRAATAALDDAGLTYEVRRYLDAPPSAEELEAVLGQLGLQPWDIVRMSEPAAQAAGLTSLPREHAARDRWIAAMVEHPSLIQRPIVLRSDGTASVARSPEVLAEVIEAERTRRSGG